MKKFGIAFFLLSVFLLTGFNSYSQENKREILVKKPTGRQETSAKKDPTSSTEENDKGEIDRRSEEGRIYKDRSDRAYRGHEDDQMHHGKHKKAKKGKKAKGWERKWGDHPGKGWGAQKHKKGSGHYGDDDRRVEQYPDKSKESNKRDGEVYRKRESGSSGSERTSDSSSKTSSKRDVLKKRKN